MIRSRVHLALVLALPVFIAAGTVVPSTMAQPPTKKLLVLIQGPDGHPPGSHEYVAGARILEACLSRSPQLDITVARVDQAGVDVPELIGAADGVVLYLAEGAKWVHGEPKRLEALARLAAKGGGLAAIHWAIGTKDARFIDGFVKLFGGCHGGPDRKYKFLETDVRPAVDDHPVVRGVEPVRVDDEFYYQLKFVDDSTNLLPVLEARIDGQWQSVAWTWQRADGGRSFGFSGLHGHDKWSQIAYRRLVCQGVLWSLQLPIPPEGLDVSVDSNLLTLPAHSN